MSVEQHNIRNFCIIAHVDHGKSTIADRLLEMTGALSAREMRAQVLDAMELERERGITIKAHPVTMFYRAADGQEYQLHLIDTPGHVDFSYEVSRSLAACEGALLVIDATQGVQAQSLANLHLAFQRGLKIVPVINKIDLPAADCEAVCQQLQQLQSLQDVEPLFCSAKTGQGIEELLEAVVTRIPAPQEAAEQRCCALVFDSHYDSYRGVIACVRMISGQLGRGSSILMLATGKQFEVLEVGLFSPKKRARKVLRAGEVGYVLANIKQARDIRIGDTITSVQQPVATPLPGFQVVTPVVYAGIYPLDAADFISLREALTKLQLSDSALHIEPQSSASLGSGFRCGFLGLLHLEIFWERLQREFGCDVLITAPSVVYRYRFTNGQVLDVDNVAQVPDPSFVAAVEEPWVKAFVITPNTALGAVMHLGVQRRGLLEQTETLDRQRVLLTYRFPLSEIVSDFHGRLKALTQGYASFDYRFDGYERAEIVKVEVQINKKAFAAFSFLIHREKAEAKGRAICKKLLELVPRQQFKVPIQALIGSRVIARETLGALGKNVTAKCYGGDITRKRKLWEKQKKGKQKMQKIGTVHLPQSAFLEVFKVNPAAE